MSDLHNIRLAPTNWDGADRDALALQHMDYMLRNASVGRPFSTSLIDAPKDLGTNEKQQFGELRPEMRRLLIAFGYATESHVLRGNLELTQKGIEAKAAGGHFAYEAMLDNRRKMDELDRQSRFGNITVGGDFNGQIAQGSGNHLSDSRRSFSIREPTQTPTNTAAASQKTSLLKKFGIMWSDIWVKVVGTAIGFAIIYFIKIMLDRK